jgi:hypothetical protein
MIRTGGLSPFALPRKTSIASASAFGAYDHHRLLDFDRDREHETLLRAIGGFC